eukprot:152554_1
MSDTRHITPVKRKRHSNSDDEDSNPEPKRQRQILRDGSVNKHISKLSAIIAAEQTKLADLLQAAHLLQNNIATIQTEIALECAVSELLPLAQPDQQCLRLLSPHDVPSLQPIATLNQSPSVASNTGRSLRRRRSRHRKTTDNESSPSPQTSTSNTKFVSRNIKLEAFIEYAYLTTHHKDTEQSQLQQLLIRHKVSKPTKIKCLSYVINNACAAGFKVQKDDIGDTCTMAEILDKWQKNFWTYAYQGKHYKDPAPPMSDLLTDDAWKEWELIGGAGSNHNKGACKGKDKEFNNKAGFVTHSTFCASKCDNDNEPYAAVQSKIKSMEKEIM